MLCSQQLGLSWSGTAVHGWGCACGCVRSNWDWRLYQDTAVVRSVVWVQRRDRMEVGTVLAISILLGWCCKLLVAAAVACVCVPHFASEQLFFCGQG